jgi:nitroreductase
MDLAALLASRRSIRRFRPEAPPRALIEQVLDAAVTAPSASNRQPWRFLVVTSRVRISDLSADVSAAVDRVARHLDAGAEASFRAYGDYFTRFAAAPVVIAPIYRPSPVLSHLVGPTLEATDRAAIDAMEHSSALTGASLALQNLLLMAHAVGLGASAMTGPLLAEPALRPRLGVPAGWSLLALVPIGYPDETPSAPERKPAARVTRWLDDEPG